MDLVSTRAILVLGDTQPAAALLAEAGRHAEVYVLARAVPEAGSRFVIDVGNAEMRASVRLRDVVERLRGSGIHAAGTVGAADEHAARRDAVALFPPAGTLLEAA
jgi:hypothetical protein